MKLVWLGLALLLAACTVVKIVPPPEVPPVATPVVEPVVQPVVQSVVQPVPEVEGPEILAPLPPRTHRTVVDWTFFASQPTERRDEEVALAVTVNGRVAARTTVSLKTGKARQEIDLPDGVCYVTAELEGRASITLTVQGKERQTLSLWLYRGATAATRPAATTVSTSTAVATAASGPLQLVYELNDESLPAVSGAPGPADVRTLRPVVCTFYREDVRAPLRSSEDLPLRIYIDERMVFDGTVRSGAATGTGFLFRVEKGAHRVRFEIPGQVEKSTVIDAQAPIWIQVHYAAGTSPTMRLLVSNDVIGAF